MSYLLKKKEGEGKWLLFFYSVPSRPVSSRMRIWRRLSKAGAVHMKGAVYILPFTDEHYEFLQWLVSEIVEMKGEAAFAGIDRIDTMTDAEIIALFNRQRADDYKSAGNTLDDLERRLSSMQKGAAVRDIERMTEQFGRLQRDVEEMRKIDFFSSEEGRLLALRMKRADADLKALSGDRNKKEKTAAAITMRKPDDYQERIWITRKKPFIDRMASAWLIRKFIDRNAAFDFIEEKDLGTAGKDAVTFDIRGGAFTHTGDLCTFEVIIRSFGLKDKTLRKMAEIVHDLDMKDGKYKAAEAKGLEDILTGIRKTAKDDREALENGIKVFEMLYAAQS